MKIVLVIAFVLAFTASGTKKETKPFQALNQSLDTLAIKSDQLLILTQKLK